MDDPSNKGPQSEKEAGSPFEIRKIHFVQSGGFAGLLRGCDLTASELNPEDLRALQKHLQAGGHESPSHASGASAAHGGRDFLTYEIELETAAGRTRLEFDESNVPEGLGPLIERLSKLAKPLRP